MVKYGVRSTKLIWAPCVQLYSLAETPQQPPAHPIPLHFGTYSRVLLVSQERRHLFVTSWKNMFESIPKVGEWIKQVDCDMDGKLSYKEQQHWNLI
jgi:hypothetical protein